MLGYECNLSDMNKEELEVIKEHIGIYKKWREVLQFGTFYRGRGFSGENSCLRNYDGNIMEWTCVSKDKEKAVGLVLQKMVVPNTAFQYYQAKGLMQDAKYHFYNRKLKYDIRNFGGLINMISPVYIKQDSLVHNLAAKVIKMDGETEDCYVYGDTLMYSGIRLKQAFAGTGYNDQTRYFQDFDSRIYYMEKE